MKQKKTFKEQCKFILTDYIIDYIIHYYIK